MNIIKFKLDYEKLSILLLLCIGFFFIALQHSNIGMYFDDYGNASLSYGIVVPDVAGTDFNLSQIITWAKNTYFNWGGRVLYAGVFLIPLLKNGIDAYMFAQSIVIILICTLSYKIVCHYTDKRYALPIIFLLYIFYGLIGQDVHVHGTYWASASILYVWPLLPLFLAIYLYINACDYIKSDKKNVPIWFTPVMIILVFFAAFSQEQIGISVILYFVFYIYFDHWKERRLYLKLDALVLTTSIISYCFLFFSPGNFIRLEENSEFAALNIIQKVTHNMPKILDIFFFDSMRIFNILILVAMIMMTDFLFKKARIFKLIALTTTIIVLTYGGLILNIIKLPPFFLRCFYFGFLMNLIMLSMCYFFQTRRFEINALVISGGVSVFCLLYSPAIQQRSYIEYLFILFIILAIVFVDFYKRYSSHNLLKLLMLIAIIFLSYRSVINFTTIFKGYKENNFYLEYNQQKLLNYVNDQGDIIYLAILPNKGYHSQMPYDPGSEFIESWMKEYYNIPNDVPIKWGEISVIEP